ncbi:MAG: hypothetical protein F083_3008 [bacterium F083]|nr:MAG: hypothetical protein F083_3008 [bacterium F083]
MKNYNLIDNICFKFFLFFLIINVILEHEYHKKEFNDLEYYFSQSICQFLFFAINYKCSINFFLNNNIYNDILEINSNVNLLINIKKSKLENIILLLGIIPFLKKNSTLSYKINNKGIYIFFKNILNEKMKNKIIKFGYNDLHSFNKIMTKLLYYNWELIPKKLMLDHFRYIVNNYYNDSNSILLQKSLNMNYKLYIQNKRNEITSDELINLLSKLIIINFI